MQDQHIDLHDNVTFLIITDDSNQIIEKDGITIANDILNEVNIMMNNYNKILIQISNFFSILLAISPSISRILLQQHLNNFHSHFIMIIILIITILFTRTCSLFLITAIIDAKRQYLIMKKLGLYIQYQNNHILPIINLFYPNNITNWFSLRLVLKNFGIIYRLRLTYLLIYVFTLSFSLLVALLYMLLTNSNNLFINNTVLYLNAIVFFIFIFIYVILIIYQGHLQNDEILYHASILRKIAFYHKDYLSKKQYKLTINKSLNKSYINKMIQNQLLLFKSYISSNDQVVNKSLINESLETNSIITKNVMLEYDLHPIKFFGIVCSTSLITGIFSLFITSIATIASFISRRS